jgi:hypothetical protein
MNQLQFLRSVTGDGDYYCLLLIHPNGKVKQSFFEHRAELVDAAANADSTGWNCFFGLGTFNNNKSRAKAAVGHLKSFFLDLDCGEFEDGMPPKFTDKRHALTELSQFCKKTKLPKPTIVDSGRGLHAYWSLTEQVCREDWEPVALRFKQLCSENNLPIDYAVPADVARVLRIPYTQNFKTDPPAQTTVVSTGHPISLELFAELVGVDVAPPPTKVEEGTTAFMDALVRNKETSFKKILGKTKAGEGCQQLAIICTDQDNCDEPLWRAGLSIAKFCKDGRKAAVHMSNQHRAYDSEETQDKFDRIKGPYLCSSFDEYNPNVCPECPNWGKIKSPIVLGNKVKEATEELVVHQPAVDLPNAPMMTFVIPTYPKPYIRGANGGVYIRTKDAEGNADEELIYHNDIYVVRRLHDVQLGEALVMRLHLPKDGVREFTVPLTSVTSKDEFRKQMSMQGVALTNMDKLIQYIMRWVNEMQETGKADEAHRQFGWTSPDMESFILGNQEIHADKVTFNPPSAQTAGLFPAFEPKGSLEGWKSCMDFYNRDNMEMHQYMVCSSFGSILMEMQPIHCAVLHVHSKESGLGKTTALAAGMSVWGNPDELIIQEQDTHATKMNRAELYHNLLVPMDEMTNSQGKELSDIAYQFTSGRQRNRMRGSVNEERVRGRPWKSLGLTTGNTSAVERISLFKAMPKAEAQRIMECHAKKYHFNTKEETDRFSAALKENYGWAAVPYVQYVIKHKEEIARALPTLQERVDRLCGFTAENRFWSVHITYSLMGGLIANRAGLLSYDMKKVEAWAVKLGKRNLTAVEEMSVSVQELISEFMLDNIGKIIRIKSTEDLRKNNSNGLDEHVIPDMMPAHELAGRYETDVHKFYIRPNKLREWCGTRQVNYGQLTSDMKSKMGAVNKKVRITKGTPMVLDSAPVWVIDYHDDVEDVVD